MNNASEKKDRLFRFYPEDFGDSPVRVIHMDLTFDVYDDHTRVTSRLNAEVLGTPVRDLSLNAHDLEILSVSCDVREVSSVYGRERNLLKITFDRELSPGEIFTIRTDTVCRPSDHVLEGLYYDRTPPGAPPTLITQCQQWGFQRLVPCIDTMTAKCTYTTTIYADERYTNIISNGDVAEPLHAVGKGRVAIKYDNSLTPMAPYLFFLGAGTYDTFTREFEYPDGNRFMLELLVWPGSDPEAGDLALQVLSDAILWVYLFTGPGSYRNPALKQQVMDLIRERDSLKAQSGQSEKLDLIREKLRVIVSGLTPGYRYTGTVYREIGMQNSDFGGMENTGNTTITMNRIMPYPQMTDPSFEYMVRVKVHEFYHNLNGSEVTGRTPFELWLNEAVTAFVENAYHAYLFGGRYSRLQTVLGILTPSTGTFALDSGSASIPIEPPGFNDPNDLITGITYVKAAEFVGMIETLMEKEQFVRALDLYHTRYHHGNATWQQWIEAMEEVSGQEFMAMARTWLTQTGFPVVSVSGRYDPAKRQYMLSLAQSFPEQGSPWIFPFRVALVDGEGRDIADVVKRVSSAGETITIDNVDEPAFLSLNREYSFYGKVLHETDPGSLHLQALYDSDAVNRFIALYRLAELELVRLIENPATAPSEEYTDLYFGILGDRDLVSDLGGLLLTLFDTVDDRKYAHRYRVLYDARRRIEHAIASRYTRELTAMHADFDRTVPLAAPPDVQVPAIKERQVKNICLGLLATLDTPGIHALIKSQLMHGGVATDRLRAFSLYLNSTAADRLQVMEAFENESASHPVSWEAYLAAVGGCSAPDSVTLIQRAASSPAFRINQVNDHRALYGSFTANRKVSLQTPDGRELLGEILMRLAPVNQNSTVSMLRAFGAIDRMEQEYHVPLIELLTGVRDTLDPGEVPVVHHMIRRLLMGAPNAVKAYESVRGPNPLTG